MESMRSETVSIGPLASAGEAEICARIMASTDPWVKVGMNLERCVRVVQNPDAEVYLARADDEVIGLVIVVMKGAFSGYINILAVRDDWRGNGIGSMLIDYAVERIFRDSPNAFILVSSFNPRARALYQRLGFEVIGELKDYIVRGHSEWLLRKTIGPWQEFRK
jgi:ribosomal-protein-alanine N-acetyltransferase